MHSELAYLSLVDLGKRIAKRQTTAVEATRCMLERIAEYDPVLGSYTRVLADAALRDAAASDRRTKQRKRRGPLDGVPVAVKDLCHMKGEPTTAGLPMFRKAIADHDATVVTKLRSAGAIIVGKLQLTEGALALHHPDVPPPINPWAKTRWSGASSSGTGVSVAAGLAYGALGSDTGGSIRFPSACNGLVGLKPTWGRVSRHGVFPLADILDHVGPLTRTVEDAAAMLGAIAGRDPNDPTASVVPVPNYLTAIRRGINGIRIGIDRKYAFGGVDKEIQRAINTALHVFKNAGATVVNCKMPDDKAMLAAWTPLCAVSAASAHKATYPRRKNGYSDTYGGFLELGRQLSGIECIEAEETRREFSGEMDRVFENIDLMIKPVYRKLTPTARAFDTMCRKEGGLDDLIVFTAPDDMTGMPTITLPAGLDRNGAPLSFQIVGRAFEESLLFRAGYVWQSGSDWVGTSPPAYS